MYMYMYIVHQFIGYYEAMNVSMRWLEHVLEVL